MKIVVKHILLISILVVCFGTACLANNARLSAVYIDYAIFYVPKSDNIYCLEVYFSFPDTACTLTHNEQDSIYSGNIEFIFTIDSVKAEQFIKNLLNDTAHFPLNIKNGDNYTSQELYGIRKYYLPAGEYTLTFHAKDLNGNRTMQHKLNIPIKPNSNKISISTLQVANIVTPESQAKEQALPFYKNHYYVYPNPTRSITADVPTLHLYSEIYNNENIDSRNVDVTYHIVNAKNDIEFEYSHQKSLSALSGIVETISFPLDAMQTGVYQIKINVVDNFTNDTAVSQNNFYLVNNNINTGARIYYTEDEQFDQSEFSTYDMERTELEYAQCRVLATKEENATWSILTDLKAKQRFLFRFWYIRNPDINNPYNTELAEFRTRLKYVNTYYSFAGHHDNGWKSDRGKIYLTFGEPDHKEEILPTPNQKAYQTWSYHSIEGGAKFVFVDMLGLGNFRLVHSTHSDHIHNYNWQRLTNSNAGAAE